MALVSLTWEIKGQPDCAHKQRGIQLFLAWAMMQGIAMLLQNIYKRQRLYTRIALGKVLLATSMHSSVQSLFSRAQQGLSDRSLCKNWRGAETGETGNWRGAVDDKKCVQKLVRSSSRWGLNRGILCSVNAAEHRGR